jgi:23S rRNA pseudouridine1911/1915/1917 synthase
LTSPPFDVLFEDNHLLVVNKPVGWVTQGALPGAASLLDAASDYIKQKYAKPGNVFLGIVSRLDKSVSGVCVIARTSKAAARLSEQFRQRSIDKTYLAIVHSTEPIAIDHKTIRLTHWLRQRPNDDAVQVVSQASSEAKQAELTYRVVSDLGSGYYLLHVDLETGRKHQIRVQLAATGLPIVGDKRYGSQKTFESGIMLHALQLDLLHPTLRQEGSSDPVALQFVAPLPTAWLKRFPKLAQQSLKF